MNPEIGRHFFPRKPHPQLKGWRYFDFREIAWFAAGLDQSEWPLTFEVWTAIQGIIAVAQKERANVFIDFSEFEIDSAQRHDLQVTNGTVVVFWGVGTAFDSLKRVPPKTGAGQARSTNGPVICDSGGQNFAIWNRNSCKETISDQLRRRLVENELQDVRALISKSFSHFMPDSESKEKLEILKSTPIIANGIYNSQRIIGNPPDFMRCTLALARLCASVFDAWSEEMDVHRRRRRFLVLSPRAAPFAAALTRIFDYGFEIPSLPRNSSSVFISQKLIENVNIVYVYIADFLMGGSELRVAEAVVSQWQGTVTHCVCLGTYSEPATYELKNGPKVLAVDSHLARHNTLLKAKFRLAD